MTNVDIHLAVKALVAAQLRINPEQVTDEADLKMDLGADSLDATEIAITLESVFEIEVSDQTASQWTKLPEIVAYVGHAISEKV